MKTAIAIRHVSFEDVGLIGAALEARGYQLGYREAGTDPVDDAAARAADLVILLGGPIGAYEDAAYPCLTEEIALAKARLEARRPLLGICLGAQVMAVASGKRAYPGPAKELGWSPLTLTAAGRDSVLAPVEGLAVLHWHGDTFDLPDGGELLASTAQVPHQAFRVGRHALGLQFHLEAQAGALERWYIGHACEIAATPGIDVPSLRRQAARHAPALVDAASRVFGAWLDGVDAG